MQIEAAGKYILDKLKNKIPAPLAYHNAHHTIDVRAAAERIGKQENITAYDMKLLLTAAWYHDSGFLICAKGHENESCRIVIETLPRYGYNAPEIDQICGLIMATRLPQTPKNHLEEILADADLDYLGREDFFEIGDRLFRESLFLGVVSNLDDWDKIQVNFLNNHHYFTSSSVTLREDGKNANLNKIKERLIAGLK